MTVNLTLMFLKSLSLLGNLNSHNRDTVRLEKGQKPRTVTVALTRKDWWKLYLIHNIRVILVMVLWVQGLLSTHPLHLILLLWTQFQISNTEL